MTDKPEDKPAPETAAAPASDAPAPEHAARVPIKDDAARVPMQDDAARVGALETELQDVKDKWLRAEADMANLRARTKREVEDARLYAVQKFAKDVVEAAENLKRGIDSLPKRTEAEPEIVTKLRDGFEGIERSFVGLLERNGIARTDPTGAIFDANFHQAMAEQPTADHPPGTILEAWSQTWTLNSRLLRPAMVVVAKPAVSS